MSLLSTKPERHLLSTTSKGFSFSTTPLTLLKESSSLCRIYRFRWWVSSSFLLLYMCHVFVEFRSFRAYLPLFDTPKSASAKIESTQWQQIPIFFSYRTPVSSQTNESLNHMHWWRGQPLLLGSEHRRQRALWGIHLLVTTSSSLEGERALLVWVDDPKATSNHSFFST